MRATELREMTTPIATIVVIARFATARSIAGHESGLTALGGRVVAAKDLPAEVIAPDATEKETFARSLSAEEPESNLPEMLTSTYLNTATAPPDD